MTKTPKELPELGRAKHYTQQNYVPDVNDRASVNSLAEKLSWKARPKLFRSGIWKSFSTKSLLKLKTLLSKFQSIYKISNLDPHSPHSSRKISVEASQSSDSIENFGTQIDQNSHSLNSDVINYPTQASQNPNPANFDVDDQPPKKQHHLNSDFNSNLDRTIQNHHLSNPDLTVIQSEPLKSSTLLT